ncbi:unnamed protein product [Aphanomyces euteiches]
MKDKVVLITGAAQGIGEAIALRMAEAGAKVALSDIQEEKVEQAAIRLAKKTGLSIDERFSANKVDVSQSDQVAHWIESTVQRWGRIDGIVNNAGIQLNQASVDITDEEWRKVMGIDLDGVFFCCREAAKQLLPQRSGFIINISSIAAVFGMPRRLPYGVAKAGVTHLTKVLAAEWASSGVRVNAIGPGYIDTEINRFAFEQGHIKREDIESKIPMAKLADPQEIAEAALFLASERSSYITGQTIFVDGGYSVTK